MTTIKIQGIDPVIKKLTRANKDIKKTNRTIVKLISEVALAESKKEAPTHKGTGVKSIVIKYASNGLSSQVAPTQDYMKFIHSGTGRYRGQNKDFGHTKWNRMRREYSKIRSRSGRRYYKRTTPPLKPGGIRPDKYMWRGREATVQKAPKVIQKEVDRLIKKLS